MIRTRSYSSSMERKNRSFTQIKDVLAELFQSKDLGFHPDDARIWSDWERIVGDPVASHARPSWIQSGRLRVLVSDSVWLQELNYLERDMVERINAHLGRKAVKKIEFRMG